MLLLREEEIPSQIPFIDSNPQTVQINFLVYLPMANEFKSNNNLIILTFVVLFGQNKHCDGVALGSG